MIDALMERNRAVYASYVRKARASTLRACRERAEAAFEDGFTARLVPEIEPGVSEWSKDGVKSWSRTPSGLLIHVKPEGEPE